MTDENISNFKGETAEKTFTITNDDGDPIDLDSGTVTETYLTVSTGVTPYGVKQFEKTVDTIENNNDAIFDIEKADTEDLDAGNYVYQVWLEYNSGKKYIAEVGKYFLKKVNS